MYIDRYMYVCVGLCMYLGSRYPLDKSPGASQKPIWRIEFSINSPKRTFLANAPGRD